MGKLCVLVALRGGRGHSRMRVDLVRGDTDGVLFRTAERDVRFFDPLATVYILFRLQKVSFPAPGRYTVEVHCDGEFLDDEVVTFLPVAGGG